MVPGNLIARVAVAGWHGQTRLTVVVPRAAVAQEDTLKLRLGVPPVNAARKRAIPKACGFEAATCRL